MLLIKRIFNYISNLGVDNSLSEKKIKRVRITNILAIATILIVIPLYFLFKNMGADFFKSLIPAVIAYQIFLLFLNKTGYINASRFIAPNVNSLIIFIYSTSLGHESLFFFYYFPAISGSFLYFELKEKFFFIIQLLFTTILIIFDLFINVQLFPKIHQSPENMILLSYFLMFSAFVLFVICLFVLAAESQSAERALLKAKYVAEEATLAKSNFLARMSHEIRTPMNAVIGLTHLTLKTKLNDKQFDYLKKIQNASLSLLGIINEILDFSKIEAAKMTLENVPFKIKTVWNNLLDTIGLKAYNKGIELIMEIDESIPKLLRGDSLRLGQILINLSDNAIKFTERGYVKISAKIVEFIKNDNKVLINFSVKDTGIGLTQKQIDNIFDSFYQADESITRNFGGTGLGLSITKQLIELMGGSIKVESKLGKGTNFYFTIEFDIVNEGSVHEKNIRDNIIFKNSKVLIAEDNLINQQVLSEMIEHLGLEYDIASNGEEAYKKILKNKYKLVLMDIQMPIMDGLAATRIIREKGIMNLPIIAMTAHALELEKKKSLEAGMNEHLTKPINPEELEKILSKYLAIDTTITNDNRKKTDDSELYIIEGIDINDGLRRVGNSKRTYFKLLREFSKTYKDSFNELKYLIEKKDKDKLKLYTHTLKGAAGMVGMSEMSDVFSEIEQFILKNKYDEAKKYLNGKDKLFRTTIESIEKYIKTVEKDNEIFLNKMLNRADINEIKENMVRLIELCNNNDSKANEKVELLSEKLKGTVYFSDIIKISEKISDIEFKEAVLLAKKLLKELKE